MMQQTPIAIGLGSNRGDRLQYLESAYRRLAEDVLQEAKCSSIYETPAWGGVARAPFLNAVAIGTTDWKPPALVHYLKQLERELGRMPAARYGDREIDLDLLVYGSQSWDSEGVKVPHPGLADRFFVLVPLAEVWPDWVHPALGNTVRELLKGQPADSKAVLVHAPLA